MKSKVEEFNSHCNNCIKDFVIGQKQSGPTRFFLFSISSCWCKFIVFPHFRSLDLIRRG